MPPTKDGESKAMADLIQKYINENDVMIFSKSWCPFCKKVYYLILLLFNLLLLRFLGQKCTKIS